MTASSTIDQLNSRLLEGLAKPELMSILAAAIPKRFYANSVVTNQGQPADRLFLLTKGRARFFSITEEGKKFILLWLPPGEIFGGFTLLPVRSSYHASTESGEGELGVDVGSQYDPRPCCSVSEITR